MKTDVLFKIFKAEVSRKDNPEQTANDLIHLVVERYMSELLLAGYIPGSLMLEVRLEIEAHTVEMFRKATYGFMTLEDFRVKKLKHAPKPRSSNSGLD